MASRIRWVRVALAVASPCLAATGANADEIGLFALTGVYNTDNALREATNHRHDTVAYFTLATYGKWETGRLRAAWGLSEEGIKYIGGSFGQEAYTTGSITAEYNLVPDLMVWHLRDNTGQILVTPTEPDTPLNRADFNVFSTGPAFHIPVTHTTWLGAEGYVSNTYYEKQTLNGDKVDLSLGYNKNLGYKTDIGAYVGQTDGTYKAFGRFKTESASLRFNTEGAFTKIRAEAGVNRAVLPFTTDALPFFDLALARKFHDTSSFDMKLQRKITNPSDLFGQVAGNGIGEASIHGGNSATDVANALDLLDSKIVRLGYQTRRNRTELGLGVYYRKEDTLEGAVREEHRRIEGIDARYHLIWGSKTGIVAYGSYEIHRGELFAGRVDRELMIGTEIAKPIWTVATRWVVTAEYSRRTGNDTLNNYQEFRIGAYLRFSKFLYETGR